MQPFVKPTLTSCFVKSPPAQSRRQGRKTRLSKIEMTATAFYSVTSVVEGDCISSLESYGEMLEQECCFSGVFCDGGDAPANF